jgi:hypothetical protein
MMTRKTVIAIVTAIFFIALAVVWSIDTIRADDITTNTTTTTTTTGDTTTTATAGDVTTGASAVTNIGGTTTYDASTETTYNVENTTTQTEIIERGYSVSPNVYLGGYPYETGFRYNSLAHEDIKNNNLLLVEVVKRLDKLDARLTRIEKTLNIKPSEPTKSSSVPPAKRMRRYSTD